MPLGLEEDTEIVLCRYKNDGSIYRQVANECNKNHSDRNPAAHNLVQELLKKFKETGPVACKPCLDCLSTIKWSVKLLQQEHVMVLRIQSYNFRISHTKELQILKKGQGSAGKIQDLYLPTDFYKYYFAFSSALLITSHYKHRAAILWSVNAPTEVTSLQSTTKCNFFDRLVC